MSLCIDSPSSDVRSMVCTPDTLWWVGGSKVGKMPDDGALDVCVSVNKFCETCSTVAEVSTVASPSWDASISPACIVTGNGPKSVGRQRMLEKRVGLTACIAIWHWIAACMRELAVRSAASTMLPIDT